MAVVSTSTQLQIKGLARDPNAFQAASGGALRRAENVVVRSEGVAESRPNFDLLNEVIGTTFRAKALHEFDGVLVVVSQNSASPNNWVVTVGSTGLAPPGADTTLAQPPNYDDTETRFAEARGNLYGTGIRGPFVVESGSAGTWRFAGVPPLPWMTDYSAPQLISANLPSHSYAYRFVLVRKDSSGYERRSPPSHRFACAINAAHGIGNGTFATGTRVYIGRRSDTITAAEGDIVECYRTRITNGLEPRPEHFLAWSYVLTNTDVGNHYFAPPPDTCLDNDLGAQLYTDSSQAGAIAAKYAPPVASALASWQRCMWFARVVEVQRIVIEMKSFGRAAAGVPRLIFKNVLYTAGATTLTVADTSQLEAGMYWTDNLVYGPLETVLGVVYVPPNTTIVSITNATDFVISNAVLIGAVDPANSGVESPLSPRGMIAEIQSGTYTNGSAIVTGLTTTQGLFAGMYWTDSQYGPAFAGVKTQSGTKILNILSSTSITMTKTATATGTVASYYGDIVTIGGLDFYAWAEYVAGSGVYIIPGGAWTAAGLNHFYNCFSIGGPRTGIDPKWLATLNLQSWLAYNENASVGGQFTLTSSQVLGDYSPGVSSIGFGVLVSGLFPSLNVAHALEIEELIRTYGDVDLTTSCTAPSGIGPTNPLVPANTIHPNRLYFSDVDEPESVPLPNYFDLGGLDEPIQAVVPLRDMLLVFKTDGIWLVTGSGPSSWSVEPVDTMLRLVRPETVCVVNGVAYAWCDRGFFSITEGGAQSLSANALDVELRAAARLVMNHPLSHGAFVIGWRRRNLVLLGVPSASSASACAKIYAYSLTTGAWSEWPMAWGPACESPSLDAVYYSRPADAVVSYEMRRASELAPRGYDREFTFTGFVAVATPTSLTISQVNCGQWEPVVGDFIGCSPASVFTYRRIVSVSLGTGTYTLGIESAITGSSGVSVWKAREAAEIVLEWHPTAPAGVPVGAMVREIHVQLDLRDADQKTEITTPRYLVGGTGEHGTSPTTLTSNKAREATIQPLRVGTSRQIARAANLAPYFKTSDISPIRVLGISLVHERTSERTTR